MYRGEVRSGGLSAKRLAVPCLPSTLFNRQTTRRAAW